MTREIRYHKFDNFEDLRKIRKRIIEDKNLDISCLKYDYLENFYNDPIDKDDWVKIWSEIPISTAEMCEFFNITGKYFEKYKEEYGTAKRPKEIASKIRKLTNLKKYGVENVAKSDIVKRHAEETCIAKYGKKAFSLTKNWKKKTVATNLKKFGVEWNSQCEEGKKIRRETNLERYGVEVVSKADDVKKKIMKTNQERYGGNSPVSSKKVVRKMKQTCIKKYGVDNYTKTDEYKEKTKETCLLKYGVENPTQSDIIKERIKQRCLEKYGVDCISRRNIRHLENYNEEFIKENFVKNNRFLTREFMKYFNVTHNVLNAVEEEFHITVPRQRYKWVSQMEVADYIFTFLDTSEIKVNDRRTLDENREIDVYAPNYHLGFEYNGLMYHSFGPSKFAHFNDLSYDVEHFRRKFLNAESKGIFLYNIFENEWRDKNDVWKSIISCAFGRYKRYIKKFEIREISKEIFENFLEENSLYKIEDGEYFGAFCKNELISVCFKNNDVISKITNKKYIYFDKKNWQKYFKCDVLIDNRFERKDDYDYEIIIEIDPKTYYYEYNGSDFSEVETEKTDRKLYDCGYRLLTN